MTSVRMGGSPNIKKIKRVVQGIVDQILNEETSLIGLTTIRDYDEYTFTHSVNVCIFSVALGKRLGLSKLQLYDLGMAALFHDIGKSRVPQSILNKTSGLTDDEWRLIAAHPWLGVLALFQVRGAQELPYRAMIVAHEHHMKRDLTGYPRPIRDASAERVQQDRRDRRRVRRGDVATRRIRPCRSRRRRSCSEMRDNPRRGMDPVIVKAFINLTGIYPVGTLVVLDTFELGIVHAVNPLQDMLSRPIVRIISDDTGQSSCIRARSSTSPIATPTASSSAPSSRLRILIDMASGSATTSSDAIATTIRRRSRRRGQARARSVHHGRTSRRRAHGRAAPGARRTPAPTSSSSDCRSPIRWPMVRSFRRARSARSSWE